MKHEDRFDYPAKAEWRKAVWAKLAQRIGCPVEKAVAIFFIGDYPHDFYAAQKAGFSSWNLIGVDVRKKSVQLARQHGCLSVQGELQTVLCEWPKMPISCGVLDYCGGMQDEVVHDCAALIHRGGPECQVAVNLLRGRDARTFDLDRKQLRRQPRLQEWNKHRGLHLLMRVISTAAGEVSGRQRLNLGEIKDRFHAEFGTYKSEKGNLVYDSVIFEIGVASMSLRIQMNENYKHTPTAERIRKSLIALMAHRTRRRDEELEDMADKIWFEELCGKLEDKAQRKWKQQLTSLDNLAKRKRKPKRRKRR